MPRSIASVLAVSARRVRLSPGSKLGSTKGVLRVSGTSVLGGTQVLRVSGKMPAAIRQKELNLFRGARPSILANSKLLGTGVDVPEVDMVVIADPKQSHVEILQIAGRASRLSKDKARGYVLIPIHTTVAAPDQQETSHNGDGDTATMTTMATGDDLDEGAFMTTVNVLVTFLEQDEQLQRRLQKASVEAGRTGKAMFDSRVTGDVLGSSVELVGVTHDVFEPPAGASERGSGARGAMDGTIETTPNPQRRAARERGRGLIDNARRADSPRRPTARVALGVRPRARSWCAPYPPARGL